MLKKSKDALDPQSWCGLNRPDRKETEVDAVLFGIPFDGGVSYRGGAAEVQTRNIPHRLPSGCITTINLTSSMRGTL